jgi:hypothetical protein
MLDGMTDEQKKMLIAQMSMQMGGAMMGSGPAANRIGRGLYAGGDALNQGMHGIAQQQKVAMEQQEKQQAMMAAQAKEQQAKALYGGVPDVSTVPPAKAYEQIMSQANKAVADGRPDVAAELRKHAEGYKRKLEQVTVRDPATGKNVIKLRDEFGNYADPSTPVAPEYKPQVVGLGGTSQVIDPTDTAPGTQLQHTMTPEGAASNDIAKQNLALQQARFAYEKGKDAQGGGVGAIKPQALQSTERTELQDYTSTVENISSLRKSFKENYAGRGAMGGLDVKAANAIGSWGSEDSQNLANWWADYEKMVNLPERFKVFGASLTAGEKEAWDSARRVRPGADSKTVKEALGKMEEIARKKVGGLRESLIADQRQPAAIDAIVNRSAAPSTNGPAIGTVMGGYKYIGGDPNKKESWTK